MRVIVKFYGYISRLIKKLDKSYFKIFGKKVKDCNSILDLGCGKGSLVLKKIGKNFEFSVGIDIFKDYIEDCKKKNYYDEYVIMDILKIDEKFSPKSFDCVVLLDVIEHLERSEVVNLIRKIENIAIKKIIIFTPNGFLPQKIYDNNFHQIHRSGWDVNIFKKMSFKVYGINGLKFIRGEFAHIKLKPTKLWENISILSNILVRFFPNWAFQLFCIKKV
ncbi:MAG: class I SAM-dependent methyltransferase [Candidatus Lokiarchaeota archaeon]|nr:class I SAM-dependent methyltransferase [Candidatus Lokiarchaeota archaeon]